MTAQDQSGAETPSIRLAEFRMIGPGSPGDPIPVHFNPESLEYTVTNNIKEQGNSTESKQQVSKSSGKLSMELVFDTTLTGGDVREETEKLQGLMKPAEDGDEKIAPVVEFAWGTYRFRGIFSSYKETLDYFSATGVPLRASISLSMTQQDGLFEPTARGEAVDVDDSEAFEPAGDEEDDDPANKGPATGDPVTDRGLAEDNGEENPRFFSGRSLSLPGGPNLQPPAAFASGGLSLGASAGFGIGVGVDVGFSAGVSMGVGIGLGIEAGIDVGLSAGFDVDIGLAIGVEASIDIGVGVGVNVGASIGASISIDASAQASLDVSLDGAVESSTAASNASSRASGAGATIGATAGVPGTSEAPAIGAFAFGGGELRRSAPDAPVRTRVRAPGAIDSRDDLFETLPAGPRFGGNASAGVPAALGAFAGLRPVPPRRRRAITLSRLRAQRPERELRTDSGASFAIGGRALDRSSSGLGADVGARASLADRIAFDDSFSER